MKAFDEKWEEIHSESQWGKYPSEEVIRFVARNYYSRNRKETKLLDLGCGAGANSWFMAREGFKVYAFDGSSSAVERARKRMMEEGVDVEIKVADAVETYYENEFFDAVIDNAVIYANKISSIKDILKESYRILKKDGKHFSSGLFTAETTGYGTGELLEYNTYRNLTKGPIADLGTIHFFTKEEIMELWTEAGFRNVKIDRYTRTDNNEDINISYYVVEANK